MVSALNMTDSKVRGLTMPLPENSPHSITNMLLKLNACLRHQNNQGSDAK
jgi:hypothetical protein